MNNLPTSFNEWTRLTVDEAIEEGLFTEPVGDDLTTDVFAYYDKATKKYTAVIEMDMRGMCIGSVNGILIYGPFPDIVERYNNQ